MEHFHVRWHESRDGASRVVAEYQQVATRDYIVQLGDSIVGVRPMFGLRATAASRTSRFPSPGA
jgi:hypothetical protein